MLYGKTNGRVLINTQPADIGFTQQSRLFSQMSAFLRLFHELLNQYQACLYSFECNFHDDSKYVHEIPKC